MHGLTKQKTKVNDIKYNVKGDILEINTRQRELIELPDTFELFCHYGIKKKREKKGTRQKR